MAYLRPRVKTAQPEAIVARPEAMRFQGSPIDYDKDIGGVIALENARDYGYKPGTMIGYDPAGQAAQIKSPYSRAHFDPLATLGTLGAAGLGAAAGYGLGGLGGGSGLQRGVGAALGGLAGGGLGATLLDPVDIERGYRTTEIPSLKATMAMRAAQANEAHKAMQKALGVASREEGAYEKRLAKMSSDNSLFSECVALGIEFARENCGY